MATKKKPNKKEVIRIPRPLGTTQLSLEYQRTQSPKTKERLKNIILNAYLNDQLLYRDKIDRQIKTITIEQLALLLNQTKESTVLLLNKQIAKISMMVGEDKQFTRAIIFKALNFAAESHALSRNQAHTLLAAQGNKYVPFLSTAVNQSLANLPGSIKPLIELAKLLQGNSPVIPKSSTDEQSDINPKNQQAYLTTDTALALINQNQQSLLLDNGALEAKVIELEGMPEVRANYQGGDWSRAPENLGDGPKKALSREERRDQRRQLGLIEDADFEDFKA